MKRFFGLCILIILLVIASGCTQPANPAATPAPTPEPTMPPATTVAAPATTELPATPETTAVTTPEATIEVTATDTPKPELTHSKTTIIYIRNNTFVPQEMMVLPGTGVTWINDDKKVHSLKTLPDTGIKFTSGEIVYGARYGYTFSEKEGTFMVIDPTTNATCTIVVKKGQSLYGVGTVRPTTAPTASW